MTKVRTILAEFCSPQKIQAINRLGLLKKEERESQPVPWRHRLHGQERRELVLSEMRMSLKIRPPSRMAARDKDKAVTAARHLIDSKAGEYLLKCQAKPDPDLGSRLGRLNIEKQRMSRSHKKARETFIKRSKTLNQEPLILVERPPLEQTILTNKQTTGKETSKLPGYMRPLRTQTKAPSNMHTIEAFIMETRKKRNVWEEVLDKKQASRFKSTTMPAIRLSGEEVCLLKLGHSLHKPAPESISMQESDLSKGDTLPESDGGNTSSVFVTQLPEKDLSRIDISRPASGAGLSNHDNHVTTSSENRKIVSEVVVDKPLSVPNGKFEETNTKR